MSDKDKKDELLEHNYDGIQEYDNQLPRWWVWQFWITIISMIGYLFYYHMGPGVLPIQQLAIDMKEAQKSSTAQGATEITEEQLLVLVSSPEAIELGKVTFAAKCAACHGNAGQGLVGPNLTDDNWIHGAKLMDIRRTITEGVVTKGMLSWKGLLTDKEINSLAVYIRSLRGSNPPGAKAPEGDLASVS